jgi:hypothetical protein
MNWFKNPWAKGGNLYPSESDSRSEHSDSLNLIIPEREKPQIFEAKVGDAYYYLTFPVNGNNFISVEIRVDMLKEGTDDEVIDSYTNTVYSDRVPAFIGDTLEIDDDHTKDDSPFSSPLFNAKGRKMKDGRTIVTSLDVIKTVLRANKDSISIVIIGNHENVTEGNIYKTEKDKKNKIKLDIKLGDFMQQRADIYKTTFFSDINRSQTMGADSSKNTYKSDQNLSIPGSSRKYLIPGNNLEGISVIYLLIGKAENVRGQK